MFQQFGVSYRSEDSGQSKPFEVEFWRCKSGVLKVQKIICEDDLSVHVYEVYKKTDSDNRTTDTIGTIVIDLEMYFVDKIRRNHDLRDANCAF